RLALSLQNIGGASAKCKQIRHCSACAIFTEYRRRLGKMQTSLLLLSACAIFVLGKQTYRKCERY
ncbi:hypothetical protein, partial [uncultured Alistipes sp.]